MMTFKKTISVHMMIFLVITLITSISSHADFGPWPHRYFSQKGLLNCDDVENCKVPQMGDIQALKEDWERAEGERIAYLDNLKGEARGLLDIALASAQEEVNRYEASLYGQVLMEEVTRSSEILKPLLEGELDLWVSNSSPVYQLFTELETFINRASEKPFDKKAYHQWFKSENTQHVLKTITEVQEDYFSSEDKSVLLKVLYVEVPVLRAFNLRNCPKQIEKQLDTFFGVSTFFKDPEGKKKSLLEDKDFFLKLYQSSIQEQETIIICEEKKVFPKPKIKEVGVRRFELKYKENNGKFFLSTSQDLKILFP